jgi:phage gp36-like protein
MPRYTSISDLQPKLVDAQIALGASTVPTAAQAEAILEQVEAEIHAHLQNRYAIPLADAESILFVRGLALSLAAERIYALAYPQAQFNPFAPEARAARDLLKHIMRGEAQLPAQSAPIGGAFADFGEPDNPKHKVGESL